MKCVRRLFVDLESTTLTEAERALLARPSVAGVVLFTRNFLDREQLRELCDAIHQVDARLVITVDQEGGRVQRFRDEFARLPSARSIGALYDDDPGLSLELARDAAWLMGLELLECGVDLSFAPVLDVYSEASQVINDRAFHPSPATVAVLGQAAIEGLAELGMAAVGKHFPGHGSVIADSHLELPVDTRPESLLREQDLLPFAECASSLAAIMTAHVSYPAVDEASAGYSARWIKEILRGELGYRGLVFSDDLAMAGAVLPGSPSGRAELALLAGNDLLLLCNDRSATLEVADWLEGPGGSIPVSIDYDGDKLLDELAELLPERLAGTSVPQTHRKERVAAKLESLR